MPAPGGGRPPAPAGSRQERLRGPVGRLRSGRLLAGLDRVLPVTIESGWRKAGPGGKVGVPRVVIQEPREAADMTETTERTQKRRRGQSLVEFALIMPMLLMITFGIVEFGRVLNAYIMCTNGAREGARAAAVGASAAVAEATTRAAIPTLNVNVTVTGAQGASGSMVTVRVTHNVVPIVPFILPNPMVVTGQAIMRIE